MSHVVKRSRKPGAQQEDFANAYGPNDWRYYLDYSIGHAVQRIAAAVLRHSKSPELHRELAMELRSQDHEKYQRLEEALSLFGGREQLYVAYTHMSTNIEMGQMFAIEDIQKIKLWERDGPGKGATDRDTAIFYQSFMFLLQTFPYDLVQKSWQ